MKPGLVKLLTEYFKHTNLLSYQEGDMIYKPGEPIYNVGFVESGFTRLYKLCENGEEVTINFFNPVFPMSLIYSINKTENPYIFEAVTDVSMWKTPAKDFFTFLENNKAVMEEAQAYIFTVFELLMNNVTDVICGTAGSKVAEIMMTIAERHGKRINGGIETDFETTHKIIASLCGLTRETASKEIKKLENEGIIQQKANSFIVRDIMGLKARANR